MVLYLGKKFTSTTAGRRIVEATCEKCQTPYFYELAREGIGMASAPYYLGQEAAEKRAERSAQKNLSKLLVNDVELVPCPKCHWINESTVRRFRKQCYRGSWKYITLAIAFVVLSVPVVVAVADSSAQLLRFTLLFQLLAIAIVLMVTPLLRSRIRPNRLFPDPPVLPPGTPPAFLEQFDPNGSKAVIQAIPSVKAPADYAIIRPGQVQLPHLCMLCLQPPSTLYTPPFRVNPESEPPVLLCATCHKSLRKKWLVLAMGTAVAGLAVAAFVATLPAKIDNLGRWFAFIVMGLILLPTAIAILPNQFCRPYKLRVLDRSRGIFSFKARNPAFTQLVIDAVREHDLL
jgi:hypothetical protein